MNWIRLQSEYFRHRKTLRIVRRLGEIAALYPIKLWTWAVEQSQGGSLRDIDAEELAMICGFNGEPASLWSAMVDCGFIEADGGESRIRSWDEHQGVLAARAERNAQRMRDARSQHKAPTSPATDETDERNETDERTEPAGPKPEEVELPAALQTPEFRAAWADWHAYRRERKLGRWASRTIKTKLAELAAMGEPVAIQSIRESIGNGWAGLFPPKALRPAFVDRSAAQLEALQAGGKIDRAAEITVAARLANLSANLPDSLPAAGRWRREIAALAGDAESVERVLSAMDARLIAALRDELSAETLTAMDAKVRAAQASAGRRSNESPAEMAERIWPQLIREHYDCPRLSLFSDEAKRAAA